MLDADDRASRRLGGAAARRRLDEARAAERVVLDRLGLDSYSDFLLRSSMGATDPSAELRLEIARSELMEAERALSAARAASDAIPEPPPPRSVGAVMPKPSAPAAAPAPSSATTPSSTPTPKASEPVRVGRRCGTTRCGETSA